MSKGSTATQLATLLDARKPIRLYVNQKLAAGDFGNPKIEVMQTCLNKRQYLGVCCVGAFAVIEYHHGDAYTVARIQHMVRSKSLRLPQDLTDAALGPTSGVRYRTNIRVFANDHVHGSTTRHTLVRIRAYRIHSEQCNFRDRPQRPVGRTAQRVFSNEPSSPARARCLRLRCLRT